jgi:alpha-galactosidase
MSAETREILLNKEVIAVDQDPLGEQGRRFMDMGDHEIWAKPLANGELAMCFMNRSELPWTLDYDWRKNAIYYARDVSFRKHEYKVRDLWQHKDIGTSKQNLKTVIPTHGVLMVRLTKVD